MKFEPSPRRTCFTFQTAEEQHSWGGTTLFSRCLSDEDLMTSLRSHTFGLTFSRPNQITPLTFVVSECRRLPSEKRERAVTAEVTSCHVFLNGLDDILRQAVLDIHSNHQHYSGHPIFQGDTYSMNKKLSPASLHLVRKAQEGFLGGERTLPPVGDQRVMSKIRRPPESIGPDTPLRLEKAAKIAFPDGSMTASGLRTEAKKGRLVIETIANKQYTTLANIDQMRLQCRVNLSDHTSGLDQHNSKMESKLTLPPGSSQMESGRQALAAARTTVQAQITNLKNISPTKESVRRRKAPVIPLKYSSPTS
jgi:hypothetical protein